MHRDWVRMAGSGKETCGFDCALENRRPESRDGLQRLCNFDREVAHARVGLMIHAHQSLLLTKHFSDCNDSAELFA